MSERDKEIEISAYKKWLEAGSPAGDGKEFWFTAEKEWESNNKKKRSTLLEKLFPLLKKDS